MYSLMECDKESLMCHELMVAFDEVCSSVELKLRVLCTPCTF